MNVNKRDFFLHVFEDLTAPESDMIMYNESNTLAWFPPKVGPENTIRNMYSILAFGNPFW